MRTRSCLLLVPLTLFNVESATVKAAYLLTSVLKSGDVIDGIEVNRGDTVLVDTVLVDTGLVGIKLRRTGSRKHCHGQICVLGMARTLSATTRA